MKTKGENYTKIPNDLLEAKYSTNFNSTQKDILDIVIRYTYGFHRESHSLSLEFIAKGIGKTKGNVQKQLKELIKCNVIIEISRQKGTESKVLKVNENYHSWKKFKVSRIEAMEFGEARVVQSDHPRVAQLDTPRVVQSDYQERNNLKKNIKKSSYPDEFEEFYREYPRSEDKQGTFIEWKKAITEHTPEEVIGSVRNYMKQNDEKEKKYLYKSRNFLKNEIYADCMQEVETKQIARKEFDKDYWS